MGREWEEFNGGPNEPRNDRKHVTLSKRGIILLNDKIYGELGRPATAKLLFDRKMQTIGIRPAEEQEQKVFPLRQKEKASFRFIHAWPFCRHFKIMPPDSIKFTEPEFENGVLVLSLHKTEQIVRNKKRGE